MQHVSTSYLSRATLFASARTPSFAGSDSDARKESPTRYLTGSATQQSRRSIQRRLRHREAANVLVAEDDPLIRNLNAQILRRAGYQATAVADGQSAWEELGTDAFDLLITDNDMPNLTGMQLVANLRLRKIKLPIILASGSADFFNGEEYRWLDFSACLKKPYTPNELLQTVARILHARR
jgi:two-component system chemotaxis response regulator CheY